MNFFSVFLLIVAMSPLNVFGEIPTLNNIEQQDVKDVGKEFSANFAHTSVTGANALGAIFGFELGLLAGITETPRLQELVKRVDSTTVIENIPHAGLLGMISIPFGVTAELVLLPQKTIADISFKNTSAAIKWTFSDILLPKIPLLSLALKLHTDSNTLSYSQTINNSSTVGDVHSKISFENSTFGYQFIAGLNLFIVRPYIGFGKISAETDLNISANGGATIFSPSFSTGQSASAKSSGDHFLAGATIDLLLLHIGFETSRVLGKDRYSFKLTAGF